MGAVIVLAQVIGAERRRLWTDTVLNKCEGCVNQGLWSTIPHRSGGIIQKGEPHERNLCATSFEERTPEEASRQADGSSMAAWNLARRMYKLKAEDKATFYFPVKIKALVLVPKKHRGAHVCG